MIKSSTWKRPFLYLRLVFIQLFEMTKPEKFCYGNIGTILEKAYPSKDIFPLKLYGFEDAKFWGPNNAHAVLTSIYGDYMQLPQLEDRKPHYKWIRFF